MLFLQNYIFTFIHKYRLHVVSLYALVTLLFVQLFQEVDRGVTVAVISFISLCAGSYFANRYLDRKADRVNEISSSHKSKNIMYIGIFCILLPVALLFINSLPVLPYILFVCVSVLYSCKVFGVRVKDFWYAKNLFAALMWYLSWLIIVIFYGDGVQIVSSVFTQTWPWFFLLLTYEIVWDMRDIRGDKISNTTTVPSLFGFYPAKVIACIEIFIFIVGAWYVTRDTLFLLGYIPVVAGIVFLKHTTKPELYHLFIYYQIAMTAMAFLV